MKTRLFTKSAPFQYTKAGKADFGDEGRALIAAKTVLDEAGAVTQHNKLHNEAGA